MTATVSNAATARTAPDYSLTGASRRSAIDQGLANAEWFQPAIDPARLRQLQTRTNARAGIEVIVWLALLIGSGVWAYTTVWSWWSIPAFFVYGALYGGAADPRWHECGHGTAFRTRWINDLIYPVASFMLFRGPTVWRWSHYRHHTDTIIVGRDAEISFPRPANVVRTALVYTGVKGALSMFWRLVRHAGGRLDPDAADFVPVAEHRKAVWESRVMVAIVVAAVVWSLVAWTPLPVLLVGGPSLYGMWLMVFFGLTQHAGLRENVLDHRYNTRTVYMNPVFRFLYLNMNYHVEHHIFPSVPYPALPALHAEIKSQLAPPLPSTWAAYRQIFSTMRRQQRDPSYEIELEVPAVASAPPHRIDVGAEAWTALVVAEPAPAAAAPTRPLHEATDHAADASPSAAGTSLYDLGPIDAVPLGDLRRVDVGDRTFVLCHLADGQVTLLDGLCTHEEVHLCDGLILDGQIECPMHNGCFDASSGAATRFPATVALRRYDVEITDGRARSRLHPIDPE